MARQNGILITVGGINAGSKTDPLMPFPNPTVGQDHERYNLANILAVGATSATLLTNNPSNYDNIFLEVFDITGYLQVTQGSVPEPTYARALCRSAGRSRTVRPSETVAIVNRRIR